MSLLNSPFTLPARRSEGAGGKADRKLLSLELELGGMAIELKARNPLGLLMWLTLDVALAAARAAASVPNVARPRCRPDSI
jgi:hypothetical protein